MWRNAVVLDFVGWLRTHNQHVPAERAAGFYGLDLYSLNASTRAVFAYLDKVDPAAAGRARQRYGCFDQFGGDMQEYGQVTYLGLHPSCESAVVNQLRDLHRQVLGERREFRVLRPGARKLHQHADLSARVDVRRDRAQPADEFDGIVHGRHYNSPRHVRLRSPEKSAAPSRCRHASRRTRATPPAA